jgi:hypothetical protein
MLPPHQLPVRQLQIVHIPAVREAERKCCVHFAFQTLRREICVGLVQKTTSFKLRTCRNCLLQHQRGIRQCAKSDSRLRGPAPRCFIPLRRRLLLTCVCGPTTAAEEVIFVLGAAAVPSQPVQQLTHAALSLQQALKAGTGHHLRRAPSAPLWTPIGCSVLPASLCLSGPSF